MSKIKGKIREQGEFGKKVGLFIGKVVAINPTLKELKTVLGIEPKEDTQEIEYTGESKEGNPYVRLDFWVRDIKDTFQAKITFFLEDKLRTNKDDTKSQFINEIGVCSWAEDEDSLPSWFSKSGEIRPAKAGEEDLYNFLRFWFGKIDFFNKENPAELSLNWKKLMKGDVSELREQIDGEFCTNFGALATVATREVNGEIKEFQTIFNRAFFPEFSMKHFHLTDYSDEMVLANVEAKPMKDRKLHEKFVSSVVGQYGCKDFYVFKDLKDYDPSENIVTSDTTMYSEEYYDEEDDSVNSTSPVY